jgi:hypothetical protein
LPWDRSRPGRSSARPPSSATSCTEPAGPRWPRWEFFCRRLSWSPSALR